MNKNQTIRSDRDLLAATPAAIRIARLRWLVNLRWIYAIALVCIVALFMGIRQAPVTVGIASIFVLENLAFMAVAWRVGRRAAAPAAWLDLFIGAQVALDLVLLGGLTLLAGGAVNPLVALMVLHLAVAASLVSRRHAMLQCIWASILLLAVPLLPDRAAPLELLALLPYETRPSSSAWGIVAYAAPIFAFFAAAYFTSCVLSRLRRINARLIESNRELSALDLTKSRFLRVSSHQLRSPLAAIHTLLSAIQEAGGFNHRQFELICKIQTRAQEAMALLDEMMLLSTIQESAAETVKLSPVDLDAALVSAAEQYHKEAVDRGLTLSVSAESRSRVSAWPDALETVLEHLLSNALKYTPAGGKVSASARLAGGLAEIEVIDSGIGIPADQQERVFTEFFRATNARQIAGGTGMGLAIVKAIVERLGGTIGLDSPSGGPTRFWVRLPCCGSVPTATSVADHEDREPLKKQSFQKAL